MSYLLYSVEDDENIATIIRLTLSKQGFDVRSFPDGESFLKAFAEQKPSLILLDLMLPGIQGKEILSIIRQDKANDGIHIIVVSARSLTSDKVIALDLGADDYIIKPFELSELVSRVNAHIRRSDPSAKTFDYDDFHLDYSTGEIYKKGKLLELTATEFVILSTLVSRSGKLVSREDLSKAFLGSKAASAPNSKALDMHIRSLRKKLGEDGKRIVSIYGGGYKIV
jgi:two-component system, OmpR family, alkaline phosphatase synthesis response regulator PhoP